MIFNSLKNEIESLDISSLCSTRKYLLNLLTDYIQSKVDADKDIKLNFICTHNSRRSHLSQAWSQAIGYFYNIKDLFCYSGGTESTALFPAVAKALQASGFKVDCQTQTKNPLYSIAFSVNETPVKGFSKTYDHKENPKTEFAAILTCSKADKECPYIPGAEVRIPLSFEDPKAFDNTPQQGEKYREKSLQIATELKYVFSNIINNS
tara:strand:+ start:78 stop:698 length:621 start_codon:yes stop_codon:yes gene_type:complete